MAQAVLEVQYTRELPIATTEILALFKSNEVVTSIPFRPSGGDLFVLSTVNPLKIDDWKADGHTFAIDIMDYESRKLLCHPKDIVSSLRDRVLKEIDGDESIDMPKSEDADNSRVLRMFRVLANGGTELQAVAGTLSETDANKFGNREELEVKWAMKAYHHAETYNNLIKSVDSKFLKLTQLDDEIYEEFRKEHPAFNVDVLNEEELKSPSAKVKWRPFCENYKERVEDYNMGTLIRTNSAEEFSETNSLLVVRIQFLAIEIARNREGFNDKLRQKSS